MGDGDISSGFRENLDHELHEFHTVLIKLAELYGECRNFYTTSIQGTLNQFETYLNDIDLIKLHQDTKKAAIDKVWHRKFNKKVIEGYINFILDSFQK